MPRSVFIIILKILIESHISDPKLYWKLIKHYVKSNKNTEKIPPLKTTSETGEEVYAFTDLGKSELFE